MPFEYGNPGERKWRVLSFLRVVLDWHILPYQKADVYY